MQSAEWPIPPKVLILAVVLVVYVVYNYVIFPTPRSVAKLKFLGSPPGEWAPYLRSLYRNTLDLKKTLHLHHTQHKDETVRVPILGPGQDKLILLPSSQRKWLVDQPDSVVSMHEQTTNHFQWNYGTVYPTRDHNNVPIHIIQTKLTREIGNLIPDLSEELDLALVKRWGVSNEWKEVGVYDTLRLIIGQAINRIFIGELHCRNEEVLHTGFRYAQVIPMGANMLWLIPNPVRRLLAPVVTLPSRYYEKKWFKLTMGEVHKRLDARGKGETGRNDFLNWLITYGEAQGDPYLLDPEVLSARILLLNAFALHTNVFAIMHMVLDIVGSGAEQGSKFVAELRQEISDVRAAHSGDPGWNKRSLAKLEKMDSCFRESQRINTILSLGPLRIVGKDGVTTPSGVFVPRGYQVGIPAYSIHYDEDIYGSDAGAFSPFRFYNRRKDAQHSGDNLKGARQAWATTSADYLSFGAGLNSCPGRFFASGMLKVLMAEILEKYDFDFQEKRQENMWFGTNHVPPMNAKMRIRRRHQEV